MEQNTMENEVQKLTLGEKLKFYFIRPQKVFAQYLEKPKFWLNLIILAVITCISAVISSIASKELVNKLMEQQMQGIDPAAAQMAQGITNFTTSPAFIVITSLFSLAFMVFISSAIYYGLAKMFGGEGTYTQMVATYVLAYYPVVIGNLISAIGSLITKPQTIETKVTIVDSLIKAFNVFGLWRIVLFALGISVVFKLSKKKSFIIVIIIWAVLLLFSLLSSGFTQAMQNMAPVGK